MNGRTAEARRQTAWCGTAAAHRRAVRCGTAAAHRGRPPAGGAHGGQGAQAEHGCGRTAGLMSGHQACASARVARSRGLSARTAGACKTARANPGTLCSSAAKKTRLCIFGARVARNTGVCMLISYKVLRFLLKHLRFRRIRLRQHCLNRANPGSSCRKKAFHANPSIYCEVRAENLGLCIFQPLLGPPASHPMQTPHLIAKQMQEAAYFASSNPLMPSSNSPSLQTASFIA